MSMLENFNNKSVVVVFLHMSGYRKSYSWMPEINQSIEGVKTQAIKDFRQNSNGRFAALYGDMSKWSIHVRDHRKEHKKHLVKLGQWMGDLQFDSQAALDKLSPTGAKK